MEETLGASFTIDVTNLKAGLAQANRLIRESESEFKAAAAGLDDWTKSEQGLEAKIKSLNSIAETQQKKVDALKAEYNRLINEGLDPTSAKATTLRTQINNETAALEKSKAEIEKQTKALDELGDEAEETTNGGLTAFGVALGNLAANIISSVISKMKDLISNTIEVGQTFDTSMSKVGAVSGATADEMETLRDKAKEMGSTTKFSASEAADAFNYMAMAGWKTEEMVSGIDGVLNLAAASGSDLATTSDIVTDALTAMGYSAKDAGRLADVMAAASSNANTNVEMMGQTFKYAAPVAGALGYTMEDTAVAIGLMANAGIKADQAGTSLRSVMTRLSAPPKECAEEMDRLGLSLTDSEGNMKSLDQVMQDLRGAFDGLSETEQTAAAKHIAGTEAMSGLLAIVNAAPADFNKLTKAVEESDGAAQKMADTMLDNLGGDTTLMKSNLESLQLMLYQKFEPALRKGIKALNGMIDVFKWLTKNGAEVAAVITGVATAVGTFMAIIKRQAIMTAFTTALNGIKAAFLGLNAVMAANPIGLVVAAIAGLVAAFAILWNKSEKFRNFWIGLWNNVKETALPIFEAIKGYFTELWEKAQPIVETIKGAIDTAIAEVSEMLTLAWEAIMAVWNLVEPFFMEKWEQIKAIFAVVSEVLGGFFSAAWENIKLVWDIAVQYFTMIWENIKVVFSAVKDTLTAYFKMAWESIKAVWDVVVGYFKMVWENIKLIFKVVKQVLSGDFSGAWESIKAIWNNVTSYFQTVWNSIKTIFSAVTSFFQTAFSNAWEAIKGVFSNVGKFFSGIWDTIKEKFTTIGTAIGDAIGGAFKSAINAVIATVENGLNFIPNAVNKVLDKINELPGVDISEIPTVSLPRLAKGGIVKKATSAIIGEDGAEAVMPLERNTGWIDELAGKISEKGGSGVTVNQTNNYSQAHSRYELFKSQQATTAAVKLALMR